MFVKLDFNVKYGMSYMVKQAKISGIQIDLKQDDNTAIIELSPEVARAMALWILETLKRIEGRIYGEQG